jgi:hypothetical protein
MFRGTDPQEVNYINWDVNHAFQGTGIKELNAANFQDIYNLTKRVGELETKMGSIKFRAQGIGGMIGIAAGAMGGPLGSIVGFGIGRSLGSFVGNGLAKRSYGAEQQSVNEILFLARQRSSQLKFQQAIWESMSDLLGTMTQNQVKTDQKIVQDMVVL